MAMTEEQKTELSHKHCMVSNAARDLVYTLPDASDFWQAVQFGMRLRDLHRLVRDLEDFQRSLH